MSISYQKAKISKTAFCKKVVGAHAEFNYKILNFLVKY